MQCLNVVNDHLPVLMLHKIPNWKLYEKVNNYVIPGSTKTELLLRGRKPTLKYFSHPHRIHYTINSIYLS